MRRVLTTLILAGAVTLAGPTFAQRGGHAGGGHVGGFSGGGRGFGGGFGGSFSAPHAGSFSGFSPRGFSAPRMNFSPGYGFSPRPYAAYPQRGGQVARSPFGQLSAPAVRRGSYPGAADGRTWNGQPSHGGHPDGHRPDYNSHSRFTYSINTVPYYPYYAWPWFGGWPYFGNWDSSDYDSGADTGGAAAQSYAEPETAPAEEAEAQPLYQSYQPAAAPGIMPSAEPAVTIVYRDGHSQQIHNYALTQSALLLLDDASFGRTQQISLQEINLPATQQVNRAAGVDFKVPVKN